MAKTLKSQVKKYIRRLRKKGRRQAGIRKLKRQGGFWNGVHTVKPTSGKVGNEKLKQVLNSEKSAMITRYGIYELRAFARWSWQEAGAGSAESVLHHLCFNAGFFPRDEALMPRFAEIYESASREIDVLGLSQYRHNLFETEERAFRDFCPNSYLTELAAFDFYRYKDPWTSALKGKKVLVIYPFADTIRNQYEKRELLFKDSNTLPKFDRLEVIPAVVSNVNNTVRFATWFEALDFMCQEVDNVEFDVALIGAGAYGLPLAAHVKRCGKTAIHMGGVTQILFGILGKRWENRCPHLFNEHWVRPPIDARPKDYLKLEGGCYW